jgi:hypothetical protein
MLTIALLLALAAFIATIASALGKAPLWVAVLLLSLLALLQVVPLR